jgi:hypothetical protein
VEDVRPFVDECDWCGRKLAGLMRRSQIEQMVVVQEKHIDQSGRPCLGSGRSLGTSIMRERDIAANLRQHVRDYVDEFINDYLAANQK